LELNLSAVKGSFGGYGKSSMEAINGGTVAKII